ncbi:MAG TPA: hypothetical protein VFJ09_05665 [Nocardioidaceae bacterium]|nr:hypothetical protein [Nocardioidaceae bacterium]
MSSTAARWFDLLDGLSRLSAQQWLLRSSAPVGASVVLLLERLAGGTVQPWFLAIALAQALLVAVLPDSGAGLVLVLLLGVHWAMFAPAAVTGWVLGAAIALLGVHLGCTLASYGPPSLVLDRLLLLRWGRRAAAVAAGTAATWALVRFSPSGLGSTSGWATGLALLVTLAWTLRLTRLLVARR